MKLALCILSLIIACSASSEEEIYGKWLQYQKDFGKNYKTPVEATKRFEIFKNALLDIEEHNKLYDEGKMSYHRGLSKYSDLTNEEYNERFPKISQEDLDGIKFAPDNRVYSNDQLPDWVDWRRLNGAVSSVKNQGQCDSCYTFSVAGAVEGLARIATNQTLELSEQALVDCSTENMGCNMGYTYKAFEFVMSQGLPTEASYPYMAKNGVCKSFYPAFKIKNFVKVSGNENNLKQALATVGPVSITIDSTKNLQEYTHGVLDDATCTSRPNHAVVLVGYGTDEGKDYWLIKNSWGPNWGLGGYYQMLRGANKCAIMSAPAYPTL